MGLAGKTEDKGNDRTTVVRRIVPALWFQVFHFKLGTGHDLEEITELGSFKNIVNAFTQVKKNELGFLLHGTIEELHHNPDRRWVDVLDIFTIYAHHFGPFCHLLIPDHFSIFNAFYIEFTVDRKDDNPAMILARDRNHNVLPSYHSDETELRVKIKF
jgi:hypothetical protein